MRLRLNDQWSRALCNLPESGMGYQCVDVLLHDGRTVTDVLVFNAEEMDWPDDRRPIRLDDIANIALSSN